MSVELAVAVEVMREGVRRYDPDLVIAPMLTTAIPADIWMARRCFIVHPGPKGRLRPILARLAVMGCADAGVSQCSRLTGRRTPLKALLAVAGSRTAAWAGGFCELAIQLGPLDDAHLQQGLRARAAREGEG